MSTAADSHVIGTAPWLVAAAAIAEAIFTAGAVVFFLLQGLSAWFFAVVALALTASLAVAETVISRIVLSRDALEIRSLRGRRRIPVEDIRGVTWEGGSGVAVQLATGAWVKLPELGRDSQGLASTMRAWLRTTGTQGAGGGGASRGEPSGRTKGGPSTGPR